MTTEPLTAPTALQALWLDAGLPAEALKRAHFSGHAQGFPSRFAVDVAAEASIAAAALAATEIDALRLPSVSAQQVTVDAQHALAETTGYFTLDGVRPSVWSPISGLYACAGQGHVRVHANFDHHRDGVLRLLGLPEGDATTREQVAAALATWDAFDFEQRATDAGLVVAALRTPEAWRAHAQYTALHEQPLVRITRVGDAPARAWPGKGAEQLPLAGLRVLDLTRILAGPAAARTLAAYGADVLMINSPHLPNIESIADMSRGKRSACLDLNTAAGKAGLQHLLGDAHVFLQGYRPGSLERPGFGVGDVVRMRPGIVYASLSAYGRTGPWADKRGFDSLVQAVSGINHAEGQAFGGHAPRALPMQMLDFASGFLLAFGAQTALLRQATQGGSWHVEVSLARVADWLWSLGACDVTQQGAAEEVPKLVAPWLETSPSGFGVLASVVHAAQFSRTPAAFVRPSVPPGTDAPEWV